MQNPSDWRCKVLHFAAIRCFAIVAGGFANALVQCALAKFCASVHNLAIFSGNSAVLVDNAAQSAIDASGQSFAIVPCRDAVAFGVRCARAFDLATIGCFAIIASSCALSLDDTALAILRAGLQTFAVIASSCAISIGVRCACALVFASRRRLAIVANSCAIAIHCRALAKFGAALEF